MSVLDRLAKRDNPEWGDAEDRDDSARQQVCWWLNAIADEVENQDIALCLDGGWSVANWLRDQAEE